MEGFGVYSGRLGAYSGGLGAYFGRFGGLLWEVWGLTLCAKIYSFNAEIIRLFRNLYNSDGLGLAI